MATKNKATKAKTAKELSTAAKLAWATRRADKNFNATNSALLAWDTRRNADAMLLDMEALAGLTHEAK